MTTSMKRIHASGNLTGKCKQCGSYSGEWCHDEMGQVIKKGIQGPPTFNAAKRIHKVVIKRMIDEDPDTSWLGEYSDRATSEYSIDRKHSPDCKSVAPQMDYTYTHDWEDGDDCCTYCDMSKTEAVTVPCSEYDREDDCDCSGGIGRNEYRYFNPSFNYVDKSGKLLNDYASDPGGPEEVRKYVRQDYERMEGLQRGNWSFIGIQAEAQYLIPCGNGSAIIQKLSSGGLWGIESDSDKSYFAEVEREQLSELREQLHAIGFSYRAIAAAFKSVEHED